MNVARQRRQVVALVTGTVGSSNTSMFARSKFIVMIIATVADTASQGLIV